MLMESKHLYQRLSFEPTTLKEWLLPQIPGNTPDLIMHGIEQWAVLQPLYISNEKTTRQAVGSVVEEFPSLIVKNVKLFCRTCEEREMFAPLVYHDLKQLRGPLMSSLMASEIPVSDKPPTQIFGLLYQCLRCHGEPEGFIVRRQGWFLSVEGRSPMEYVEVPKYIPNKEYKFFQDALIAFNSGKTLAALLYLRTFIEQFARRQTGIADTEIRGDELIDTYSKTLPDNIRGSMPSLKKYYGTISKALHEADANDAVFEDARENIERHFELRKAHRIQDVVPTAK